MSEDYFKDQNQEAVELPEPLPSLDVTWPLFLEPGMDGLVEGIDKEVLAKMFDFGGDLQVFPFQDGDDKDRLFLGRFEIPKYKEDFQHPEAFDIFDLKPDDPAGFIDFMGGFPIDNIEMLVIIGQYSSKAKEGEDDKVNVQPGDGATAPVPPDESGKGFFEWPEKDKILLNLTAIPTEAVAIILAPNLDGEPELTNPHFWFRVILTEKDGQPVVHVATE